MILWVFAIALPFLLSIHFPLQLLLSCSPACHLDVIVAITSHYRVSAVTSSWASSAALAPCSFFGREWYLCYYWYYYISLVFWIFFHLRERERSQKKRKNNNVFSIVITSDLIVLVLLPSSCFFLDSSHSLSPTYPYQTKTNLSNLDAPILIMDGKKSNLLQKTNQPT